MTATLTGFLTDSQKVIRSDFHSDFLKPKDLDSETHLEITMVIPKDFHSVIHWQKVINLVIPMDSRKEIRLHSG